MSKSSAPSNGTQSEPSYFQQQRDLLIRDISTSMEQVLQNINKLNRNLEGVVAVGGEFSAVEALWSHFESVMARNAPAGAGAAAAAAAQTEGLKDTDDEATVVVRETHSSASR